MLIAFHRLGRDVSGRPKALLSYALDGEADLYVALSISQLVLPRKSFAKNPSHILAQRDRQRHSGLEQDNRSDPQLLIGFDITIQRPLDQQPDLHSVVCFRKHRLKETAAQNLEPNLDLYFRLLHCARENPFQVHPGNLNGRLGFGGHRATLLCASDTTSAPPSRMATRRLAQRFSASRFSLS